MPATLPCVAGEAAAGADQPFIAKNRPTHGSSRHSSEKNGETRKEGKDILGQVK